MFDFKNINLLQTEFEGHTGEYWPQVVAVQTEHNEVHTKNDQGPIFPSSQLKQASLVSSLLHVYGTRAMLVLNLPAFEHKNTQPVTVSMEPVTVSMETVCMAKSQPRKNQSEHSDLPQDYLAI